MGELACVDHLFPLCYECGNKDILSYASPAENLSFGYTLCKVKVEFSVLALSWTLGIPSVIGGAVGYSHWCISGDILFPLLLGNQTGSAWIKDSHRFDCKSLLAFLSSVHGFQGSISILNGRKS